MPAKGRHKKTKRTRATRTTSTPKPKAKRAVRRPKRRRVADVLTPHVEQVDVSSTIEDAARKMSAVEAGVLPVFEGNAVAGMLTDRDIVVRVVAAGRLPGATRVRDAMTVNPVYCYLEDGVDEAARLMAEHRVRRLIVLDQHGKLAGILSITDLAARGGDDRLSGETLWSVSESPPAHP